MACLSAFPDHFQRSTPEVLARVDVAEAGCRVRGPGEVGCLSAVALELQRVCCRARACSKRRPPCLSVSSLGIVLVFPNSCKKVLEGRQ